MTATKTTQNWETFLCGKKPFCANREGIVLYFLTTCSNMSYITEIFLGLNVIMHTLAPGTLYMCMLILDANAASILGGILTTNKLHSSSQD